MNVHAKLPPPSKPEPEPSVRELVDGWSMLFRAYRDATGLSIKLERALVEVERARFRAEIKTLRDALAEREQQK